MSDVISDGLKVLSQLRTMNSEPRGVSRSLSSTVDDAKPDDVSPTLTQNEQTRVENIGLILGDAIGRVLEIGKYRKGPEAAKIEDLTPNTSNQPNLQTVTSSQTLQSQGSSNSFDLLTAAGIGALLYSLLKGNFAGISQAIYRALSPQLAKLKKVFQAPLNTLKSGITRVLGSIKSGLISFGETISTKLTSFLDEIKNSKAVKALQSKFTALKNSISTVFDNIVSGVKGFVDVVQTKLSTVAKSVETQIAKLPGGAAVTKAVRSIPSVLGSAGASIGGTFSTIGQNIKSVATKVGSKVLKPVKDLAFNQAGKLLSKLGGEKGLINFFKKAFGKVPIVAPFLELLFGSGDIKEFKSQYAKGEIDLATLQQKSGNRVLEGLTGLLGGSAGAVVGTVLGGPIGTFLGSIAGDVAGRYLIAPLAKAILPESSLRKVGSIVTGTEMQDFLVKEGKVYSFNSKDEILGMKTGGAVDSLMKDLTTGISADNKFIKQALVEQIKQQNIVIEVLTAILNKRDAPIVVNSQQPSANYIDDDFRRDFRTQTTLALA